MNPPTSAPAIPSSMVMMNPPGSFPGISNLAITPITRPNTIHDRTAIVTLPFLLSAVDAKQHPFANAELARGLLQGESPCQRTSIVDVAVRPDASRATKVCRPGTRLQVGVAARFI